MNQLRRIYLILLFAVFTPQLSKAQIIESRYFENESQMMYVQYNQNKPVSFSMIFADMRDEGEEDGVIVLKGMLETTEIPNQYTFHEMESKNSWTITEAENGSVFTFSCASGDCYDKNDEMGLWKEPFHFVLED